jgi:hypothetical protein
VYNRFRVNGNKNHRQYLEVMYNGSNIKKRIKDEFVGLFIVSDKF